VKRMKIVLVVSAFLAALLTVSPVHAADQLAAPLKGTWTGSSSGYQGTSFTSGFEKIVITKTKGRSAVGTWQYKTKASDKWSKPERVTLTVFPNDASGLVVYGADAGGVYSGELTESGELTLAYSQVAAKPMTLQFQLSKR